MGAGQLRIYYIASNKGECKEVDGAVYIVGSKWAFLRVSITFETKEIQELDNKIMKERD